MGLTTLAACGTPIAQRVAARHRDGILRIGIAAAPSNINPLDSGSEVTRWIAEPLVETLYAYDDQHNSVPLLAKDEPEVSPDGLTWRITVRDDVTFHNGDRLGAADVVATLSHVNDLGAGSEWITFFLGYIQKYRAVDEHTVEISLTKPYGLLRSHLTNMPIVHRDSIKRKNAVMGTGPFKLDKFVPGQSFSMSAYPGYHGEKPGVRGIQYTVFQDGATRMLSLRQGKVDLITAVPYTNLGSVREDSSLKVYETESPTDILCYVGMGKKPFSDENFRRAVALSMDREAVRIKVFGGAAAIGQGPIGPAERGYDPDLKVLPANPDLEQARELLAKSPLKDKGFTLTIGTNQTTRNIATVLAAGWEKVGIKVRIEQLPGGAWSNKLLDRSYDMIMNIFQSGFTCGPANYIALAPAQSTNVLSCGLKNPEVDRLMDVVWQTSDEDERTRALTRIDELLVDEVAMFPPVYPKLVMATLASVSPMNEQQLAISRITPQSLRFT